MACAGNTGVAEGFPCNVVGGIQGFEFGAHRLVNLNAHFSVCVFVAGKKTRIVIHTA